MMIRNRRVGLIPVLVALSSCATVGHPINPSDVDKLQPGVSTIQDAVALLGEYSGEAVGVNGVHVYSWSYGKTNGFTGHMQSAAVMLAFDQQGKLLTKSTSGQTGQF